MEQNKKWSYQLQKFHYCKRSYFFLYIFLKFGKIFTNYIIEFIIINENFFFWGGLIFYL